MTQRPSEEKPDRDLRLAMNSETILDTFRPKTAKKKKKIPERGLWPTVKVYGGS